MQQPGDYHVILRPLPDTVPGVVRLRRFLKTALRGFGLRCVTVDEVPPPGPPTPSATAYLEPTEARLSA